MATNKHVKYSQAEKARRVNCCRMHGSTRLVNLFGDLVFHSLLVNTADFVFITDGESGLAIVP